MKPKKLVTLCYLCVLAFWLLWGLAGVCRRVFAAQGDLLLTAQDFEMHSFPAYSTLEWDDPPYDPEDPDWFLSTDSDPQLIWQGEAPRYVRSVVLHAVQYYPPGTVTLYYRRPGQAHFSEAQKVFAQCTAPGEYTFDLGGRSVAALRIDPDSRGGIPTLFRGVELRAGAWYAALVPGAGQWLLLLFAPLVLAAAAREILELRREGISGLFRPHGGAPPEQGAADDGQD